MKILLVDPRGRLSSPQLSQFATIMDLTPVLALLLLQFAEQKSKGTLKAGEPEQEFVAEFFAKAGLPSYKSRGFADVLLVQDVWTGKLAFADILRLVRERVPLAVEVLKADLDKALLSSARPVESELIDFFEIAGSYPQMVASDDLLPALDPNDSVLVEISASHPSDSDVSDTSVSEDGLEDDGEDHDL